MSEAIPKYAKYEGKSIDPLLENPVNKSETGVQKYDDFFKKAKLLIIKVHLGKKIASAKSSVDIPDKAELLLDFASELPSLAIDTKQISEEGNNLVSSAQADFMGPDILKLPAVLSELAITTKELTQAGIAIPQLLIAISSSGGDDIAQQNEENSSPTADSIGTNLSNTPETKTLQLDTAEINTATQPSDISLNLDSKSNIPIFSSSQITKERLYQKKNILIDFKNYLNNKKKGLE